ncbi:MAG: PAS domain S-box protein, partial [Gammaproteobacteria bacterium]|nr:PAS domain S-box protein [Gammaproteobacteria bacterium]
MNSLKDSSQLAKMNWLLATIATLFLIVWLMPTISVIQDVVIMSLPTHMFAEIFSVIVSMLVFALVYSTRAEDRPGNPVILACAFLVVGLVDFAHTLSYYGMPVFVTPGSAAKSIYFWLVARYIAAIALLVSAVLLWKQVLKLPNRYWLLLVSLVLTVVIYWVGLYHLDVFPVTFIEGQGLTPFKVIAEYGIILILLVPAILFYLQANKSELFDSSSMYAATVITILSELSFTLYSDVSDIFNLLGHTYKVIAYIFIFRAIFLFVVREPYQKLHESEQYNRTLFESSSIGLAVCRMDGTLIDLNQSYADIIGRSIEETKQLSYWQITPEEYMEQEQYQLEMLEDKQCYGPYQKEYLHKDGHRVPVRLSGRLIERENEALIWSSVENISDEVLANRARDESEQNFRQLVEHMREVFWLTDVDTNRVIYISPAYEVVWGRSCESLYAEPTSFIKAIHNDDRERVKQSILRQKEGSRNEEYRIVKSDGTVRWIKDQSFPVLNQEGVVYRVAGIAEDITEEKFAQELLEQRVQERTESLFQKERELIIAKEEAERANRAKSQFLSSMSHELRTPLNAILGFSQLLEFDQNLNKDQQDSIRSIQHGGRHLLLLINEVLDLEKIETGKYEINIEQVDIHEILMECVALSEPLITQYEVLLSLHADNLIQPYVSADKTKLKQVILNLISNACKYNHSGGTVDIECINTNDQGILRLSITDNGNGIEKEQQASIFEPFNRLGAEF